MSLAGKVALITGASRGIGAAIALKLAQDGATVALAYASPSSAAKAEALVAEIAALGGKSIAIQADFADGASPQRIVDQTISGLGTSHIDILVNNAGIVEFGHIEDPATASPAQFDRLFSINTKALFFTTQAVLPHMPAGGRIINISSVNARIGMPGAALYSASKAAIEAITRVLAVELGPKYGLTVNAVNPGPTWTDMQKNAPEDHKAAVNEFVKTVPMGGRMGTPEDIADVVAFLASDASRWVSGDVVSTNGGLLLI